MLSPDYLLRISEGAEEIAEELHADILNRVIERIMTRIGRGDGYLLTAQDKWQLQVLTDAGYLLEDVQAEITQRVGIMQTEIAEAMEDAGVKAIEYDDAVYRAAGLSTNPLNKSPALVRIMQRNYEATLGEWMNFTGTMATATQQSFIRACDKAYQLAMSGAISYSQAVKEALDTLITDGVTVTYPSGHTDTIETATMRAVRTGISQASGQITDARMDEMGWDIILVSSHIGARPGDGAEDFKNHAWWQGKFYSKSGKDKRFPPWSVCGMGHVQGIHGANCRHSHGPGDGKNNPYEQYDTVENRKAYEIRQRQRTLERRIRDTERQTMNWKIARDNATDDAVKADLDFQYQRKAALLQKQNKAYNDFCGENDLKKRSDRISIAKWDRRQAAAARGAARKYENDFTSRENSGTMKAISGARITNINGSAAEAHAERYYGLVRKMKTDAARIAQNTGYSEAVIQRIKNFIFVDTHDLGDPEPHRFDPSFAMAQSWQRLINGTPEPHDLTLLKHEIMEKELMGRGMSQRDAHIEASKKYNYTKESDDYYAALKKRKNRK